MVSNCFQDRTYKSKLAIEEELSRLVRWAGAPAAVALECATRMAPYFETPPPTRPARRGYSLIVKTWAIKAEDFALFEQLAPMIVAVAVLACDPESPGSASGLVASAVVTAISLAKRLRNHAVQITEIEYAVLTTLVARNAPTDVATIASVLHRRDELWRFSIDEIAAALKSLAEAKNGRGGETSLVQTRDGSLWSAPGV